MALRCTYPDSDVIITLEQSGDTVSIKARIPNHAEAVQTIGRMGVDGRLTLYWVNEQNPATKAFTVDSNHRIKVKNYSDRD